MRRGRVFWALVSYLVLRWILAVQPGYVFDVQAYKRWALYAGRFGLAQVYQASDMDYPPFYAYILYPLGRLYGLISPEALEHHSDTGILTFLIKLPPLAFDLGVAALMYYTARRVAGSWGRDDGRKWGLIAAGLYLLNPTVLFDTGFWGQPDCIHSFFVLAAFLSLFHRRAWVPWALLTLAVMMKPLAIPYFPLLAVLSLIRHGFLRTIAGGVAALAVATLAFSPFILTGQIGFTLQRVFGDALLMAHTSSNAHNIWWVVGGWQNSEVPMLGPLTATQISMVLFAVFYLALLGKIFLLWRGDRPGNATALSQVPGSVGSGGLREPQALAMVLLVAMTFFMVATHMHENHMFAALPLALPLVLVRGPLGRRGIVIYAAVSLAVLFNIVSHDPRLTLHAPFTWGGETGTDNLHLHRPMLVGERWAIRCSTVWNLAVFGGLLIWSFLPNGLLDRLGQVEDRPAAAQ